MIAFEIPVHYFYSDRGMGYDVTTMKFFTNWPKVYAIPNQEASTVSVAMLTNFFCRFGVPLDLHSDYSRNIESKLMQVVLE